MPNEEEDYLLETDEDEDEDEGGEDSEESYFDYTPARRLPKGPCRTISFV